MITLKRNAHMTPLQPPAILVLLWGDFGRVNLAYIRDGKAGGPSSAAIAAAKTAAVLRSLVASCDLVKVDPFVQFHDAPSRIADDPMTPLGELLPHRWSPVNL